MVSGGRVRPPLPRDVVVSASVFRSLPDLPTARAQKSTPKLTGTAWIDFVSISPRSV